MSRAGELLVVGYEGVAPPDALLRRIADGRVGGVCLFARNVGAPREVAAAVAALGDAVPAGSPPIIVSIDQEGGRVQRLREPFTRWPPMRAVAAADDEARTEAVGRALGEELRLVGINVDFAPVVDVWSNPVNAVIGDRAFGSTPEVAARHALAFLRGLEAAGVRGCAKHFPGHGDTVQDSHDDLPRIDSTLERLRAVELAPFAAAVRAGVRLVMTAHVVFAAVDDRPATLSARWIDGMLRGELGYTGAVVSDDLDMQAVAARFSVEETVRAALGAGVDLMLACRDPARQASAEEALERAHDDPALGPRVDAALVRARSLRAGLAPARPVDAAALDAALPDPDHQRLAASFS